MEVLSIIPGNMTLHFKQPISHQMLFDIAEALMHLVEKMALVLRIKENVSLEEGSLLEYLGPTRVLYIPRK